MSFFLKLQLEVGKELPKELPKNLDDTQFLKNTHHALLEVLYTYKLFLSEYIFYINNILCALGSSQGR